MFIAGALLFVAVVIGAIVMHGVRRPPILHVAGPLPRAGEFPHRLLDAALRQCVTDSGMVDYGRLRQYPHDLESYAAHLARVSPDSHPGLFPTREDSLAYWINAYNGLALLLALDHYPLTTLRTLDDPTGLLPWSVFLTRRFDLGGRWWSLHALERRVVSFKDPRTHFVLNCASRGCPALGRAALDPGRLDTDLDEGVRRFLRDPRRCRLDPEKRTATLSPLFQWHASEIRNDLSRDLPLVRRIGDRALLSWIEPFLDDAPRALLRSEGAPWHVTFYDWDWSLNAGTYAPELPRSRPSAIDAPSGR